MPCAFIRSRSITSSSNPTASATSRAVSAMRAGVITLAGWFTRSRASMVDSASTVPTETPPVSAAMLVGSRSTMVTLLMPSLSADSSLGSEPLPLLR